MDDGLDQINLDAVMAAANLAERAGASYFQLGHTDADAGPVTWWASVKYGQTELMAAGHPDPESAATALAKRILTGAKCKCGGLVALSVDGAWAPGDSTTMLDGSDPRVLRNAPHCLWILDGQRWQSGCDAPPLDLKLPWRQPAGDATPPPCGVCGHADWPPGGMHAAREIHMRAHERAKTEASDG